MKPADEAVVALGAIGRQLAEAEVDAPIAADAHKGPLAGSGAVAAAPDAIAQLEIAQRHCDFPPARIDVALVHRPRKEGQGLAVGVGLLFPIPALQQVDLHGTGIEVEGIGAVVRLVAERLVVGAGEYGCSGPGAGPGQRWGNGHQKGEKACWQSHREHPLVSPQRAAGPGAQAARLLLGGACVQSTTAPSATNQIRSRWEQGWPPVKRPKAGMAKRSLASQ